MTATLYVGDCRAIMASLEPESFDSIVTDPPYGLEFMGKDWDNFKTERSENYAKGGAFSDANGKPDQREHNEGGTWFGSRPATAPSYTNRPAKRCAVCGRQSWSGSPCVCESPRWIVDNSPLRAFQAWCEAWAAEAYRVLKPGGYLLAFGGTRTFHRLTCGLEDAGFEIRDCLMWLYGSGFPKSLDVSKAIDKAAGAARVITGTRARNGGPAGMTSDKGWNSGPMSHDDSTVTITSPATDAARKWDGWGTALKPAWEPIIVARKPLIGTVAANVQAHGTGALNIAATRIEFKNDADKDFVQGATWNATPNQTYGQFHTDPVQLSGKDSTPDTGRWPANLILDETAAAMLDEQSGERAMSGRYGESGNGQSTGLFGMGSTRQQTYFDTGGASRFFYTAKASRAEREIGMYGEPKRIPDNAVDRASQRQGIEGASGRGSLTKPMANHHPTVKPIDLMQWLCRLVTQPGGRILDPFCGSGSTGIAAAREGFSFVGIDQSPEYVEISRRRIQGDAPLFNVVTVEPWPQAN